MKKLIHRQTKLDKEENLAGRESIAKREPSVWGKETRGNGLDWDYNWPNIIHIHSIF